MHGSQAKAHLQAVHLGILDQQREEAGVCRWGWWVGGWAGGRVGGWAGGHSAWQLKVQQHVSASAAAQLHLQGRAPSDQVTGLHGAGQLQGREVKGPAQQGRLLPAPPRRAPVWWLSPIFRSAGAVCGYWFRRMKEVWSSCVPRVKQVVVMCVCVCGGGGGPRGGG